MSIRTNIRGLPGSSNSPITSASSLEIPASKSRSASVIGFHAPSENNVSEIAEKIRRLEELLAASLNSDDAVVSDRLRCHNGDLSQVLQMLRTIFPKVVGELLLLSEEERVLREELQAELQAIHLKWRTEVCKLHEILAEKAETIRVLSESERSRLSQSTEIDDLERRVHEAEAERDQLRLVIKSLK